jgi:hypothetical protein
VDARDKRGHDDEEPGLELVMAGLVPAIHVFIAEPIKTWMPARGAGMTTKNRD